MTYTVIATWVAKDGQEDEVARILRLNAAASQTEEPGCRDFTVLREQGEPGTFVLYEVYDDEAAFDAHRASAHYKQYVLDDVLGNERLQERFAKFYDALGS